MKKTTALLLSATLIFSVLTGCSSNVGSAPTPTPSVPTPTATPTAPAEIRTGLAILSNAADSTSAGEQEGAAKVSSTAVALTVDGDGVILSCVIDGVQTSVPFTSQGKLNADLSATFETKNELGDAYGMKKVSSIGKEWNEQAAAFAQYAVGKTVAELKGISLKEGVPDGPELSSSVTIHVTDFMSAIEKAVASAQALGAQAGDKLGLGVVTGISKSKDAGEAAGLAQTDSTYGAVTFSSDGKVTSCVLDGCQTSVSFDGLGQITSDINAPQLSKNELGEAYSMKKVSSIGKEWNEQAAAYAAYITGKTLTEIQGIALKEGVPDGPELSSSVTIHVTDFNTVIEKAAQYAR